jgi:hypothetical protein
VVAAVVHRILMDYQVVAAVVAAEVAALIMAVQTKQCQVVLVITQEVPARLQAEVLVL